MLLWPLSMPSGSKTKWNRHRTPTRRVRTRRRRWSGVAIGLVLLTVLVAVDGLAIWGIFSARRSARAATRVDLELQTQVHARSLESLLANLRADLVFLSQSPPIAQLPTIQDRSDPMVRRWLRLNAEGTLLLFFAANPAVERIAVRDAGGKVLILAGRLDGEPQILPADSTPDSMAGSRTDPEELPAGWLRGSWGISTPEVARLDAWIDAGRLLGLAAPGVEDRLLLEQERPSEAATADGTAWVTAPVVDDQWQPPVAWWLTRREAGGQVMRSFEELSRRYRTTLIVNLAVILLTLALATVAYRQVRWAARLEVENEQQARVRELERRLMHNERLASVGRLAAGLAHEINNPLEGMANFLSVLEEDLASGDLEGAARWTPKLRHGLERSASVIRQVLAFSDPARAPKEPVQLTEILDETVDFVGSNPAFRGVTIEWQAPPEEVRVLANRTTLGQLFLNLLLNACEAEIEKGAEDSLIAGTITVALTTHSTPRPLATVTVSDRGSGFNEDALEHLFEPFYSGRGSSGLGLAVCHGIVQDLDGRITASNRPGGGAEMRVDLPLPQAPAACEAPAALGEPATTP
jgi:signal transduction histidine kinase